MSMIGNFFRTDRTTIDRIQHNELQIEDLIYRKDCHLDIDKTWHALHFMMEQAVVNGAAPILSQLIFSETPVNDTDLGYGPAMLLTEDQVTELAAVLKKISKPFLRQLFDLPQMLEEKVYPLMDEDDESFFDYVWGHFAQIIPFFQTAAEKHCCMLFYID